jgi:hypothetical protein
VSRSLSRMERLTLLGLIGGMTVIALGLAVTELWPREDAATEAEAYLHEVLLGFDRPVDAVHAVAVNSDGLVAAAVDPPGDDDRPRVVVTDGTDAPRDLSGTDLLPRSLVHGLTVDRRGNVTGIAEHTRAGVTQRRAIVWGVLAGAYLRTVVEGAWDEDGQAVGATEYVPGRRPASSEAGSALALADITDGTGQASYRVLDPMGGVSDAAWTGALDEDEPAPAMSDGGLIVVSDGQAIVGIETGVGRAEDLVPASGEIGAIGAVDISPDGRIIVFIAQSEGGRVLHAIRRTSDGWSPPIPVETDVAIVDDHLAVGSHALPPEVGNVGLVLVRGREASSGDEGLWTVLLDDRDGDAPLGVREVRPVVLHGQTIAGRTVREVLPAPDLTVPRTPPSAHPDAHWIAFTATTDEGPLMVRAVPTGSGLELEARFPTVHDHDDG